MSDSTRAEIAHDGDSTRAEIAHDGDSTLITGTSRDDTETIAALKAAGFRWSRRIESWYLPRTWTEPTRWARVQQVRATLGEPAVSIDADRTAQMTPAQREQQRRSQAADRAERLHERSEALSRTAEAEFSKSDAISSRIPFGQPILMGHHSQRRAERDQERMRSYDHKGIEADQASRRAAHAATRAEQTASGQESQITLGNRIDRLEVDQRRLERRINGTGQALYGEATPASGAHREELTAELARVTAQLHHERGKVIPTDHGPTTIHKGDLVKVRGTWYPVVRANKKSVTVPSAAVPSYTHTAPWREVTDHAAIETISIAHRQQILDEAHPAFPELNALVAQALPPDQPHPDSR